MDPITKEANIISLPMAALTHAHKNKTIFGSGPKCGARFTMNKKLGRLKKDKENKLLPFSSHL